MALDENLALFQQQLHELILLPLEQLSVPQFRQLINQLVGMQPPAPTGIRREDKIISMRNGDRLRIRLYLPDNLPKDTLSPALVYYHGGGFVTGSIETSDFICGTLAHSVPCVVVSVDYRVAPEFPFPAAVHDSYDAFMWVVKNGKEWNVDPDQVAVGGESSGATLATVTTIRAPSLDGIMPCFQFLAYPITDATMSSPSYQRPPEPLLFYPADRRWLLKQYLRNPKDAAHYWASPLFCSYLSGLSPAYIITAEYDVLRDEGSAYVEALRNARVPVEHIHYQNMIHGFLNMASITPVAQQALERAAHALGRAFTQRQALLRKTRTPETTPTHS